jgi:hypothetical protein
MMKEAAELGILPPQKEALKFWGFYGIQGVQDLFVLWRIYMLLIHRHRCDAEELAKWCAESQLAGHAIQLLGSDTPEGRWLAQHGSRLYPTTGTLLSSLNAADTWYSCALTCFDSVDIQQIGHIDTTLLEKRKCYLAFGMLNLKGFPNPNHTRNDVNIWHKFGFDTCEENTQWFLLCKTYVKAIQANSATVLIDGKHTWCHRFEFFWGLYNAGNLVSWVNSYT